MPLRATSRSRVKTSPFIVGDGGVPNSQICGFGRAEMVGRIAAKVSSDSSWASSRIRRSAEKPRPEFFERAKNLMTRPSSSRDSWALAVLTMSRFSRSALRSAGCERQRERMRSKPFFAVLNSCAEWTRSFASGKAPRRKPSSIASMMAPLPFWRGIEQATRGVFHMPPRLTLRASRRTSRCHSSSVRPTVFARSATSSAMKPRRSGAQLRRGAEEAVEFIVALLVQFGELGEDRLRAVGERGLVARAVGVVEGVGEVVAEGRERLALGGGGGERGFAARAVGVVEGVGAVVAEGAERVALGAGADDVAAHRAGHGGLL